MTGKCYFWEGSYYATSFLLFFFFFSTSQAGKETRWSQPKLFFLEGHGMFGGFPNYRMCTSPYNTNAHESALRHININPALVQWGTIDQS